jgi:ppGpp synthetase/RelA/SpoT-type nucleotidyltranferase
MPIEIQVRTSLQQIWAELSEKYSDVIDPLIKYGGGDVRVGTILQQTSSLIAVEETVENDLYALSLSSSNQISEEFKQKVDDVRENQKEAKLKIFKAFSILIANAEKLKEELL